MAERIQLKPQFTNKIWRVGLAVVCVCTACLTSASHSYALDILTAIELAEQNDANYRASVQESLAKNADGWALVATMGPSLMVSGKMMRSRLDYSPEEIADLEERHLGFNDHAVSVTLDQPLIDIEKIYRARRGGCEMDIAALEQEKAREALIVLVVERYFHILSVQDSLELANAKLKLLKRQLEMARESHDLGLGDQADLYDIQARFATTRAIAALEEAKLVDARAALEELMGQPIVESLAGIMGDRGLELPENDFEYWLQRAKKYNVDIRLSSLRSEAARLDGKIGAGRFLPALSFFAEYDSASPDNDISGYGWDRERTDYGLKLQMELLSGGRDLAGFAAREHRYKASRQQVVAVRRAVSRKIEASWNTVCKEPWKPPWLIKMRWLPTKDPLP